MAAAIDAYYLSPPRTTCPTFDWAAVDISVQSVVIFALLSSLGGDTFGLLLLLPCCRGPPGRSFHIEWLLPSWLSIASMEAAVDFGYLLDCVPTGGDYLSPHTHHSIDS